MKDGYWLVGYQYELTGNLYSLGRIPKCKSAMLKHVKPGDKVKANDKLMVLEAMKMNNYILSPHDGIVNKVFVKPGDNVPKSFILLEFE